MSQEVFRVHRDLRHLRRSLRPPHHRSPRRRSLHLHRHTENLVDIILSRVKKLFFRNEKAFL